RDDPGSRIADHREAEPDLLQHRPGSRTDSAWREPDTATAATRRAGWTSVDAIGTAAGYTSSGAEPRCSQRSSRRRQGGVLSQDQSDRCFWGRQPAGLRPLRRWEDLV